MGRDVMRVVLADDHAIVLHGLESLFLAHRGFDVVACCRDGAAAVNAVRHGNADVLVVDLRMPGFGAIDVQRAIVDEGLRIRTIVLTAAHTDAELIELLRLGIVGLVLKESSPDALIDCVRRVGRGERVISAALIDRARREQLRRTAIDQSVAHALTARELDIVKLVALGRRNKAVAETLAISEGTVKIHLHNIYQKLEVDGRLELLLWAQEQGIAPE
jgi:DNA-binding NarL/FixJ family response regulator